MEIRGIVRIPSVALKDESKCRLVFCIERTIYLKRKERRRWAIYKNWLTTHAGYCV